MVGLTLTSVFLCTGQSTASHSGAIKLTWLAWLSLRSICLKAELDWRGTRGCGLIVFSATEQISPCFETRWWSLHRRLARDSSRLE